MKPFALARLALLTLAAIVPSVSADSKHTHPTLKIHNELRSKHRNTPHLTWSTALAAEAKRTVSECKVAHHHRKLYTSSPGQQSIHHRHQAGKHQNGSAQAELASVTHHSNFTVVISDWYHKEQPKYNYSSPSYNRHTAHFAQIVWAATTQIGCASHNCNGTWHHACKYSSPPVKQASAKAFRKNVKSLKKTTGTAGTSKEAAQPTQSPSASSPARLHKAHAHKSHAASPASSATLSPASSPVARPAASSSAAAAANSSSSAIADEAVNAHNAVRAKHQDTPPMTWDQSLADYGQNYLDDGNCAFQHSGGPYGENLAAGYHSVTAAVNAWYDEISKYNYASPGYGEGTGHFTQVVWKASTRVGCATRSCPTWVITICNYSPPGNVVGGNNFRDNVLPLK